MEGAATSGCHPLFPSAFGRYGSYRRGQPPKPATRCRLSSPSLGGGVFKGVVPGQCSRRGHPAAGDGKLAVVLSRDHGTVGGGAGNTKCSTHKPTRKTTMA